MFQQAADPDPPSRKDYVDIVEDADEGIGRILDAIDRRQLAQNTLVIFISDNGGEWLSRNAPYFHRKDTLWEGGIRVPAILRWPGVLPPAATSNQVAMTMDLTATILKAAGADIRNAKLEGIDLLPLLAGRTVREALAGALDGADVVLSSGGVSVGDFDFVKEALDDLGVRQEFWRVAMKDRQQRAVRRGNWKLLLDGGLQMLFDVAQDPGERDDRAAAHPDIVAKLKPLIEAWEKDVDAEAATLSKKN